MPPWRHKFPKIEKEWDTGSRKEATFLAHEGACPCTQEAGKCSLAEIGSRSNTALNRPIPWGWLPAAWDGVGAGGAIREVQRPAAGLQSCQSPGSPPLSHNSFSMVVGVLL